MRRKRTSQNDSLEMLLDTITNTFGGILFVAMLVAILVKFAGSRQSETTAANARNSAELQAEVAEKTAELESLRDAASEQIKTLVAFKSSFQPGLLEELLSLGSSQRSLESRYSKLTARLNSKQLEQSNLEDQLQRETSELELANQSVKRLGEGLANELKKRTQVARLPALRTTDKREFATVMRYGKLYFVYATEIQKGTRMLNYNDFIVLSAIDSAIRITPKPYAGLPIDDSSDLNNTLQKTLVGSNLQSTYLAIAIWEDSFAEFKHLRKVLVEQGWEYRLIPIQKEGYVEESNVEKAQVQ